jgi:LPS-assembly lipoprotein
MKKQSIIYSLLLFILVGCGFHLRGSQGFNVTSVWIESAGADRVTQLVKWVLVEEGVKLAESAEKSQVILLLSQETMNKRVLSVSANSGNLEELELNFYVDMTVQKPDGEILLDNQRINLLRDYSFDEKAVLAMGAEEEVIQQELFHDIVAQIVRRLQSVQIK